MQVDASAVAGSSIPSPSHVEEHAEHTDEETAALSEDACLDEVSAFMGAATIGMLCNAAR